jgi:hypothetical protein
LQIAFAPNTGLEHAVVKDKRALREGTAATLGHAGT